jgi:O-acetyl-ADP-ribose deacetylase (regulator of RNase III)
MPVEFVRGDLFGANGLSAIAHGCDCSGSMRKGLANQFRRRWPALFEEYRIQCEQGELRVGDVLAWHEPRLMIFNLAIQKSRKHQAESSIVQQALRRMVELAEKRGLTKIGLPRIGSGAGRLDWPQVRAVIDVVARHTPVTLVVFEQFEPEGDVDQGFSISIDPAVVGSGYAFPASVAQAPN